MHTKLNDDEIDSIPYSDTSAVSHVRLTYLSSIVSRSFGLGFPDTIYCEFFYMLIIYIGVHPLIR